MKHSPISTVDPTMLRGLDPTIAALASGPLSWADLDALVDEALAGGDAQACADLILTIHGRGAIHEARKIAGRALTRFPGDAALARVSRLVAAPQPVRAEKVRRIDRRADLAWLAAHAAEYPGEWLVLSRGRLWAHSARLDEAQEAARAAGLSERPLLHHVSAW